MAVGAGLLKKRYRRKGFLNPKLPKRSWVGGVAAAILSVFIFAEHPVEADEFDALAVYSAARPLNDRWQACAASYVQRRLHSRVSTDALARAALRNCRSPEVRLHRFF